MKSKLSLLILVLFILVTYSSGVVFAVAKEMDVIKGTPVIDGNIDDIWDKANVIDVKTRSYTFTDNPTKVTAKVWTLWDEDNLYCLAEVIDPVISATLGTDPWERDSIEFVIDQSNNREVGNHFDEHGGHYRVDAV